MSSSLNPVKNLAGAVSIVSTTMMVFVRSTATTSTISYVVGRVVEH